MISKLCLLGRPRAWNGAGVELDWPKKAFLLLGRLAVAEGETELTRADLAEFLWPDSPPEKARAALRTMLKRMRAGVEGAGKAALRLGPDRIALRRDALECDLLEALRDLEQAEPAALARALARLDHAFLAGVTTSDPTIGAWIEAQRARIRNMTAEKARRALNARIYGADARLRENLARRVTDAEPIDSDALNALNKIERSQRRILILYPKRQQGNRMFGGDTSILPLKINTSGVIPPIFASSLLLFPATIASFQAGGNEPGWAQFIATYLSHGQPLYLAAYVGLIVFFCFFYTTIVFNPADTADNLKKNGGFVPGIRPGKNTAEYLEYILNRLTLVGALYLSVVCILPELLIARGGVPFYFGGTSLLIVVSVTLDTVTQIQAHLLAHQYEGLIKKARLRGRGR